ncbi:hypothetical protein P3X46_005530 [Hevea brasiliensis]|uniref:Uncharacterized protein n=2 Tax=Hevea brasiliensis TaxID=3981 RepID=A0ABQ9N3R0_HEVBR|nr:hypothetical protein GH714_026102 [Hevea brasiliensis]KAJ9185963.1 hypothetical protein P3X46_005530 [Hevea brasiliensis]
MTHQENPDTRRALIDSNSNSYFSSITISQTKIRIKIPKLLAKTMQKRGNDRTRGKKNKWEKVSSIFSSAFNSNKLPRTYSKVQISDVHDRDQEDGLAVAEAKISIKDESDGTGDQSPLSKSYSFKEPLEIEDGEQKRPNKENIPNNRQPRKADKSLKMSLSFSRLFHKRANNAGGCQNTSDQNGVGRISDVVIGEQASTRSLARVPSTRNISDTVNLPRVPSRILTCRWNFEMSQSLTKFTSRQGNEGKPSETEDRDGKELCKKRILMGEKCRPLSFSGILEYDRDGILLPDIIP